MLFSSENERRSSKQITTHAVVLPPTSAQVKNNIPILLKVQPRENDSSVSTKVSAPSKAPSHEREQVDNDTKSEIKPNVFASSREASPSNPQMETSRSKSPPAAISDRIQDFLITCTKSQIGITSSIEASIQQSRFFSTHTSETFIQNFNISRPLQEAWRGKNISFIFHGGSESVRRQNITFSDLDPDKSFILKICECILNQLKMKGDKYSTNRYKMEVSMLELYQNRILDVLFPMNPGNFSKSTGLNILTHPKYGPYCPSCANFRVRSLHEVKRLLQIGLKERPSKRIYASEMQSNQNMERELQNMFSWRPASHLIFQIVLTQTSFDFTKPSPATETISKITIADIAGNVISPTVASKTSSSQTSDSWIIESNNVFSSVVLRASNSSYNSIRSENLDFIPYRDSNLTLLLKDSLGGNCQSDFILCLPPTIEDISQIKDGLELIEMCSSIRNKPAINRYKNDSIIAECEECIQKISQQMQSTQIDSTKYARLKSELQQEKELLAVLKKSPKERMQYILQLRQSRISELLLHGFSIHAIGSLLDLDISTTPYMISLRPSKSVFDNFIYFFTQTTSTIGAMPDNNFVLESSRNIRDHHALIQIDVDEYNEDEYILHRMDSDAAIFINGVYLEGSIKIHSGDRIILGEEIFQFIHPKYSIFQNMKQEYDIKSIAEMQSPLQVYKADPFMIFSTSAWEKAKLELIEKRFFLLENENRKCEDRVENLNREIVQKGSQLEELNQRVLKSQETLSNLQLLIDDRTEKSKKLDIRLDYNQKCIEDAKAHELQIQKDCKRMEEEMSIIDSEVRMLKTETRHLQEIKTDMNQELLLLAQEKKVAMERRDEYLREKEYYDEQMQKNKTLTLKTTEKSLLLNQKLLEIQEVKIKLREKELELQSKINAIHEKELEIQEKSHEYNDLLTQYEAQRGKIEFLEEQFRNMKAQYKQMRKKKRKSCCCFSRIFSIFCCCTLFRKKKNSTTPGPIHESIVPLSSENDISKPIFKSEIKLR